MSGYTLHFYAWRAGHHQQRPELIELPDPSLALPILRAVAAAISQPGSARAALVDDEHVVQFYLTDDYVDGAPPANTWDWLDRPLIVYGEQADLDAIAGEAMREAVEDVLWRWPEPRPWDGRYIDAGDFVLTTLTAERISARAEESECPIVAAIVRPAAEVLAELRAAATENVEEGVAR